MCWSLSKKQQQQQLQNFLHHHHISYMKNWHFGAAVAWHFQRGTKTRSWEQKESTGISCLVMKCISSICLAVNSSFGGTDYKNSRIPGEFTSMEWKFALCSAWTHLWLADLKLTGAVICVCMCVCVGGQLGIKEKCVWWWWWRGENQPL